MIRLVEEATCSYIYCPQGLCCLVSCVGEKVVFPRSGYRILGVDYMPSHRWYYRIDLKSVVRSELRQTWKAHNFDVTSPITPVVRQVRDSILRHRQAHPPVPSVPKKSIMKRGNDKANTIRTDIIRRLDVAPHRINPVGNTSRTVSIEPRVQVIPDFSTISSPSIRHGEVGFGRPSPPRRPQPKRRGILERSFPGLVKEFERTMTVPRTETLIPTSPTLDRIGGPAREVPYLSFSAVVGRNSTFHGLDENNRIELAGVEYGALSTLLWVVPMVC